jgi:hypothetical protein
MKFKILKQACLFEKVTVLVVTMSVTSQKSETKE